MNLNSMTSLLAYLARFNPRLWEIIHPHVPLLSVGSRHVMASMVIKSISKEIKNADLVKELQLAGKSLFDAGAKTMSYDDDDWCPTRPRPPCGGAGPQPDPWRLIFGEEVMLNPQPLPPQGQAYYGALLTILADTVSLRNTADTLRNIGTALMDKYSKELNENAPSVAASFSDIENGH